MTQKETEIANEVTMKEAGSSQNTRDDKMEDIDRDDSSANSNSTVEEQEKAVEQSAGGRRGGREKKKQGVSYKESSSD